MRLKRWIGGVCAAVLCLGGVRGICLEAPAQYPDVYEVQQPSGEIFKVETYEEHKLPFDVGQEMQTYLGGNLYRICLGDDGYWYYKKYAKVIIAEKENPDNEVATISSWDEWYGLEGELDTKTPFNSIYCKYYIKTLILENKYKYLIDPLPNKVFQGSESNPFAMRETSQEEKDAMAMAIEAERERLGKNVTSVISDPGPEMFIYEPVETEESGESIAAETDPPQTSVQAEEISSASSQPASSQPADTTGDSCTTALAAAEPPEDTGGGDIWILLLCGGGVVVIVGVVVILLLQRRKKKTA